MFRYLNDGEPYKVGDQYLDMVMRDWRDLRVSDIGKLHKECWDMSPLVIVRRKFSEDGCTQPTASNTGYKFADAHAAIVSANKVPGFCMCEDEMKYFRYGFEAARLIS